MHIPKLYREEDRNEIVEFLKQNEFATLVTCDGSKPIASHLLMEVIEDDGSLLINGHMSKANPQWKTFAQNPEVLVIFQGPHAYISPTWYNHVNVPTWNYQSVHVYGGPRIVTGQDEMRGMLSRLIARNEGDPSYRMETLPADFVLKEMAGVVAFQVEATRIEANYKLSQNRDDESYWSVVSHLEEREDAMSHEVAHAMKKNRTP